MSWSLFTDFYWHDLRQHLVQLAFHDNFCDISFNGLWEEARRKQELLNLTPVESMGWCNKALHQCPNAQA